MFPKTCFGCRSASSNLDQGETNNEMLLEMMKVCGPFPCLGFQLFDWLILVGWCWLFGYRWGVWWVSWAWFVVKRPYINWHRLTELSKVSKLYKSTQWNILKLLGCARMSWSLRWCDFENTLRLALVLTGQFSLKHFGANGDFLNAKGGCRARLCCNPWLS